MKDCAIHYDDRVVLSLAFAVMMQAVKDWKRLNRESKEAVVWFGNDSVYRGEMELFYCSSFFANLIEILAPSMDVDEAFKHMDEYKLGKQQLGYGRGAMPYKNKPNKKRKYRDYT